MPDSCVVNASPLILLARGGHLDLLREFAPHVWVPSAVAEEIRRRGATDPTAHAIAAQPWLRPDLVADTNGTK